MYTIVIADDEAELRQALIRRIDWKDCSCSAFFLVNSSNLTSIFCLIFFSSSVSSFEEMGF